MLNVVKLLLLFGLTAVAEIVGCYLPWLWLRKGGAVVAVVAGGAGLDAVCLAAQPASGGGGPGLLAYGGVYVAVALLWLWLVDGMRPSAWDIAGAAVALCGMAIIMLAPRPV